MEVHGGPEKRKRRKKVDPDWLRFMSEDDKEKERLAHWHEVFLSDAGLSVRIANALEVQGIFTLGALAQMSYEQLSLIPNLGTVTIKTCVRLLDEHKIPHQLYEPPSL